MYKNKIDCFSSALASLNEFWVSVDHCGFPTNHGKIYASFHLTSGRVFLRHKLGEHRCKGYAIFRRFHPPNWVTINFSFSLMKSWFMIAYLAKIWWDKFFRDFDKQNHPIGSFSKIMWILTWKWCRQRSEQCITYREQNSPHFYSNRICNGLHLLLWWEKFILL